LKALLSNGTDPGSIPLIFMREDPEEHPQPSESKKARRDSGAEQRNLSLGGVVVSLRERATARQRQRERERERERERDKSVAGREA